MRLPSSWRCFELELIQPHMAQKPVLRGEVGCACVAREVSVERGGMGERGCARGGVSEERRRCPLWARRGQGKRAKLPSGVCHDRLQAARADAAQTHPEHLQAPHAALDGASAKVSQQRLKFSSEWFFHAPRLNPAHRWPHRWEPKVTRPTKGPRTNKAF